MNLHILPFGEPVWACRTEIIKEIIKTSPGPPYDYRRTLWLVANARKLQSIRTLFLDSLTAATGSHACIPPTLSTLSSFMARSTRASATGNPISGLARTLAVKEAVRRAVDRMPETSGSAQLSGMKMAESVEAALDMLYIGGVSDTALRDISADSVPLGLLLSIKREYESLILKMGFVDASASRFAFAPKAEDFPFEAVIMDGFHDADEAEARIMAALSQKPVCHFILQAPGISMEDTRATGGPYHGADRLLAALGVDVSALSCTDAAGEAEGRIYTGAVFHGRPLHDSFADIMDAKASGGLSNVITVTSASSQAEEVYHIARRIKEDFIAGLIPDLNRVLVFFPRPEEYLPLVREAFADYGIPFQPSFGDKLSQSPASAACINLLSVTMDEYAFRRVRRAIGSPLIMDGTQAVMIDRLARRHGITSGQKNWRRCAERLAADSPEASVSLMRLLETTATLVGERPMHRWADTALEVVSRSGIEDSAARAGLEYDVSAVVAEIEAIKSASKMFNRPAPLWEFISILKSRLTGKTRFPGNGTGVNLLKRLEVSSAPFDRIYAGGLSESALPAIPRSHAFLPDGVCERLRIPGSRESATRDARLFISLLLGARDVHLSYPESGPSGRLNPSPYILALEPFFHAGIIASAKGVSRPIELKTALGRNELLRDMTLAGLSPCDIPGSNELLTVREERAADTCGEPYPTTRIEFSVTELESYISCGYAYYQSRIVKNRPVEDPEEDADAGELGTRVHKVLCEYYTQRLDGVEKPDMPGIIDEEFRRLSDTLTNNEERRRITNLLVGEFAKTEEAFAASGFSVTDLEMTIKTELELDDIGTVTLTGKIDRLEVDAQGNFIVADYKTGRYPGNGMPLDDQFQLPMYAWMYGREQERTARMKRPVGFVYYNLQAKRSKPMRDLVVYDSGAMNGSNRRGKGPEEFAALIQSALDMAVNAIRGIRAGVFNRCEDGKVCRYCDYTEVCRHGADDAELEEGGENDED